MKINTRKIQIVLGLLWLLDGVLQLQPKMMTSAFASQVVDLSSQGQPGFISALIHFGTGIFLIHPVIFDLLIALIQLTIGLLILLPKTLKAGLLLSIAWGLFVWSFGEGFGGLFNGQASLLMGAPGAALLYVLLAAAVYPRTKAKESHIAYWLVFAWSVLWVGGGVFQLLPPNNSITMMSNMISANANGSPGWIATTDRTTASLLNGLGNSDPRKIVNHQVTMSMIMGSAQAYNNSSTRPGFVLVLGLALVEIAVGIGALLRGWYQKLAIVAGVILSLCFWLLGQNLGSIFNGLGTDPNSGPLLILMGVAIVSCPGLDVRLKQVGSKISDWLLGETKESRRLVVKPSEE